MLGIAEVVFLRFPDQGLEDCSEFREKLVRQIRIHRPETVVTIDPHRRSAIEGKNACVKNMIPFTFTRQSRSRSSSFVVSTLPTAPMPALFTKMSSR